MLHKEKPDYNRNQSLDQLVPANHFLRQVEVVIDFDFIYDLVEDTYS
ncbi:TPA: IS5/IS1182 family transposase, partial [Streptococcus suis]|nr:IS5/IS1182 family transposase [Streptococcus suis]